MIVAALVRWLTIARRTPGNARRVGAPCDSTLRCTATFRCDRRAKAVKIADFARRFGEGRLVRWLRPS